MTDFAYVLVVLIICVSNYFVIHKLTKHIQKTEVLNKSETPEEARIYNELFESPAKPTAAAPIIQDDYVDVVSGAQIVDLLAKDETPR